METIKKTLVLVLVIIKLSAIAQNSKEAKFEKKFNVNASTAFTFINDQADLKINTWDKDEVRIIGKIKITGGVKEDVDKLVEVFKNPTIKESSNNLEVNTDFMRNFVFNKIEKTKVKWYNFFRSIKINTSWKHTIKYELWIPKSIQLVLKSEYSTIDIADLMGKVKFKLHESKLNLSSFNEGNFNMRYTTVNIGKGKSAKFDVYNCKLNIDSMSSFSTVTKYSDFNVKKVQTINLNSYEDKFFFNSISDIVGSAKYSKFKINNNINKLELKTYEVNINTKNINALIFSGKYSQLQSEDIQSIKCNSLYEIKLYADKVGSLKCTDDVKYSTIRFKLITKEAIFNTTYELSLEVDKVATSFNQLTGEFKYGNIKLPLPDNLHFSLDFETKYGSMNFPQTRMKIKEMSTNTSTQTFLGSTSENPKCKIKFIGHDVRFDFKPSRLSN